MKQIVDNIYIKEYRFLTKKENDYFFENQKIKNRLCLEKTFGEYYYNYIYIDSLSQEKLFVISFNSDENNDNLSLLFWGSQKIYVVDTGMYIYMIDYNLNVISVTNIEVSLIGLYVIDDHRLLILEEANMRIMNNKGDIIKEKTFDLIEHFSIKDCILQVKSGSKHEIVKLK